MISQYMTTSFKQDCFNGFHAFSSAYRAVDTFMLALYTNLASLDYTTTAYTSANEVVATGYTAGGIVLTPVPPASSGTTAYISFADVTWPAAISAAGGLIYNATQANKSVAVLSFGYSISSITNFVVHFPVNGATTSVVRFQ